MRPHGQDEPRVGAVFDGRYQVATRREVSPGLLLCDAVRLSDVRPVVLAVGGSAGQPAALERFEAEAARLLALRHPNVTAVLGAGRADGERPYLALEAEEGRALAELVADEAPFDPRRVASLGADLLRALDALDGHDASVGQVAVADVVVVEPGTARERARLDPVGLVRRALSPATPRAEGQLASAGAVMFEMMTGLAPVEPSADRPAHPTLAGAKLLGPLVDVVTRLLSRAPDAHFASAGAALAQLGAADPDATTTAPGPGLGETDLVLDPLAAADGEPERRTPVVATAVSSAEAPSPTSSARSPLAAPSPPPAAPAAADERPEPRPETTAPRPGPPMVTLSPWTIIAFTALGAAAAALAVWVLS